MATIIGTPATEVLNGTADDDIIIGLAGADFIFGKEGDDRSLGGSGIDGLNGEDGNDILIGGTEDDAIFGGEGDDISVWRNGDGSDFISGDAGQDTQIVSGSLTDGDSFILDQDIGTGQALFSRDNLGLFELRIDTVELLRIAGNGGNDRLVVADLSSTPVEQVTFVGGEGDDALISNGATTDLVFVGGAGRDIAIGGSGDDRLVGGDDNDQLIGGAGNDRIIGGKGDDDIEGGDGDDFSIWNNGDGSDLVLGDAGNDTQRFNMADGPGDEITLSGDAGVATFARTNFNQFSVEMVDVERIVVTGLDGDDILTLDDAEDGGIFSVNFAGGNGQDKVLIDPASSVRVIANGGEGDDQLNGDAANDVLIGGGGQDLLVGNDGRDRLLGQAGDDTLTGGGGRDVFVFTPGGNNDRITDFEVGSDLIRFNLATFVFDDLNISDSGGDLRIQTPDGDSVTLLGLAGTTLTAADVLVFA